MPEFLINRNMISVMTYLTQFSSNSNFSLACLSFYSHHFENICVASCSTSVCLTDIAKHDCCNKAALFRSPIFLTNCNVNHPRNKSHFIAQHNNRCLSPAHFVSVSEKAKSFYAVTSPSNFTNSN